MTEPKLDSKPAIQVIIDTTETIQDKQPKQSHVDRTEPLEQSQSSSALARLHAGYFRITLSLGSQALLWKILSEPNYSCDVLHVFQALPSLAFILLWWLAFIAQALLSCLYALKCVFHFKEVKAEFLHHIGINYLYLPWVSWIILLEASPVMNLHMDPYLVLCFVFAVPVLILDIKLYGQWFTTERKCLSVLGNPSSQLSVMGNLVVSRTAALLGFNEIAICMFSLGMVHYLVLFVTLYQRLSGGENFPSLLRPAFFLFFAVPSIASLAWNSINGSCDTSSKMLFLLSLFIFSSLACRPTLFKKSLRRFNVAWWAYSFTLTLLALASAEYAEEVKNQVSSWLMLVLSALSVLVFLGLMLLTAFNTDRLLRKTDPVLNFTNNMNMKPKDLKEVISSK